MMAGRFAGRRALVTGGARGIGAGIAERLVDEGADVVIADIDGEAAQRTGDRIGAWAVQVDVADPDAVQAAVAATGPFGVLVNNAGVDAFAYFTDVTPEQWRRLLAINLEGVFACTQAALPAMQDARYGRIVNVGSEAGRIGSKGNAVYAAAKGGVIAFTKSIARENARYGITVNAVLPGPIETPLLREMDPKAIEVVTAQTQLRRLGTVAEVAAAVTFLAAEESSYVTGEILGVSGGMALGG
ncbi:MAG: 3-oxoacyl-ACP reductase [Solirubrobacterales bacterium]|nr:3-oxoacyl-ACP reductase [Solirubrobacterales bacterium]